MLDNMAERLSLCKKYMIIDHNEDVMLISSLLAASDEQLEGAGINRDDSPSQYDLVVNSMTLEAYETRGLTKMGEIAQSPAIRQRIVQLKLRSNYGGNAQWQVL